MQSFYRQKTLFAIFGAYLALILPVPTEVLAQTPATVSPPATPPQHETAEQLFQQTCQNLQKQPRFTVQIGITYDNVLDSGSKVQYSAKQYVWVAKPNRLRSDYVGDERNTRFYYDGRTFTYETPEQNLYATKAAPASIDETIAALKGEYNLVIPLASLFASDPCAAIDNNNIREIIYIGQTEIDDLPSHQILMIGEDRDFQLWISESKPPLLQKVIITYKDLPASPQYTAILSNWNFSDRILDETFLFTPAKNSHAIEFLPPGLPANP